MSYPLRTIAAMTINLYSVRFGAPAAAALAGVVDAHKLGDPFAPVTVLVADNLTGVMARRSLGAHRGVVNVSFVTPAALAAQLSDSTAISVSSCVLAAAVRDTLARQTTGLFAPVAAHPATEAALLGAYHELAGADGETLAELARSPSRRTRAVVALCGEVRDRLTDLVDEHDLARSAARCVADGKAAFLGSLVGYLVDHLAPAHVHLLLTLGQHLDITLLVGATGVADADAPVEWWNTVLERSPGPAASAPPRTVETLVFTASDSDDEVRHVVRAICAHGEQGVALSRMAVLYPAPEPYARLVHEHLEAAGLAHNGPAVLRLGHTVAGRAVQAMVDPVLAALGRSPVLDLAASVPGHGRDGSARPVARWEQLSRDAGVVAGLADWQAKLAHHARNAEPVTRAEIGDLQTFVEVLAADLDRGAACSDWPTLASWLVDALRRLVGDVSTWPAHEQAACEAVLDLIAQLGTIGRFDRRPSLAGLARVLRTALDVPATRIGTLGTGIQVGPLEHGRALDADVVFIVGLAEGMCPRPPHDDTLLPDIDRRRAHSGELALGVARVGLQHRALLGAMSAARLQCVLGFPRGDHRGGRTRLASRWLLDVLGDLTGKRPSGDTLGQLDDPTFVEVPSFLAGLRGAVAATHVAERRLQVLSCVTSPLLLTRHRMATPPFARGISAQLARASASFTEWDGNLAGCDVPSPANGAVLSATRLESWATCPFRYFLSSLLHVHERAAPDELDEVAPTERGSLMHRILERFIGEVVARPPDDRPQPGTSWTVADATRLQVVAGEEFALLEARGLTGAAVLWRLEQRDLRRALDQFLVDDAHIREREQCVPETVERPFGFGDAPPLQVTLRPDRVLAFRGWIDRVDRDVDGRAIVFDYKTGKLDPFKALVTDPVVRGTKLQLPLYALAAASSPDEVGAAHYWFLGSPAADPRVGYRVDAARLDRTREVLTTIVDGIEAGMFVAHSGADNAFFGTNENCRWCDYDRVCPRGRARSWAEKTAGHDAADGALAAYVTLTAGVS